MNYTASARYQDNVMPKMYFEVNIYASLLKSLSDNIRLRGDKPEKKALYKEVGLVDSDYMAWSKKVEEFVRANREDLVKSQLFNRLDLLDSFVPFAHLIGRDNPEAFETRARSRMKYADKPLTDEQMDAALRVLSKDNLQSLVDSREFITILRATNRYKQDLEILWKKHQGTSMERIKKIVGSAEVSESSVDRKNKGRSRKTKVVVLPRLYNMQRISEKTPEEAVYCFSYAEKSKRAAAYSYGAMLHTFVHESLFPYGTTMTKQAKRQFHSGIKYLTDKEAYVNMMEGNGSFLDIVTKDEDIDLMGKMYPYYLAYKYRRLPQIEAETRISEEIRRDMTAFSKMRPEDQKRLAGYRLEKLAPGKISRYFKGRYVTLADLGNIDIEKDESKVIADEFISKPEHEELER